MTALNDPTQLFSSFKTKVVEFPAVNGHAPCSIKLRELTADEWKDARKDAEGAPRPDNEFEARVIFAGTLKDDGRSPLFASAEECKQLPRHIADKLGDEIGGLMGLWTTAQDAEETLKNSDATKTSDSDTSSD